jgi:protein-disulfide isomerase
MNAPLIRRFASFALVVSLSIGSMLVARGVRKPFSPTSPQYRQKGPADAKVIIVEFSDFECPACRYAEKPLHDLLALYEGKIRFIFKHFPLRMHQWARPAAIAAECAGRQGRFWEYHDRLYDRQQEWVNEKAESFLVDYARTFKLDMAAWQACRRDPALPAILEEDISDGGNAWVGSTPTFFINGKRFVGSKQLGERGTTFVEKELKR